MFRDQEQTFINGKIFTARGEEDFVSAFRVAGLRDALRLPLRHLQHAGAEARRHHA